MPCFLDHDQAETFLHDHGKFARQGQHSGVRGDQPVPFAFMVVQRQQEFPIVELRQPGIDRVDGDERRLWRELVQCADDRLGEVVVEREVRGSAYLSGLGRDRFGSGDVDRRVALHLG